MRKGTDTILVTGATGQQGGALANELLTAGHKVAAFTRKPQSDHAKALAARGATIIQGDLNDEASLRRAAEGKWGMFAVQNTWEAGVEGEEEQGHRAVKVGKAAGIQHFVYASVASADRRTGIPHFDNKARVEESVRKAGFPSYAIVRPVFFMENLLGPWFKPYIEQGNLAVGIKPETKLQMIAVEDIGKYLFRAFDQHERMKNSEIDIAGDSLTMPATAYIISRVSGKPVSHYQVPIEEVRKNSEDFAKMLEWFDAVGYDVDIAANEKEFGIKPTSFGDWAGRQTW